MCGLYISRKALQLNRVKTGIGQNNFSIAFPRNNMIKIVNQKIQ